MGMSTVEVGGKPGMVVAVGEHAMRVVMNDGKLFEGTPLEICRTMQSVGFGEDSTTSLRLFLLATAARLHRLGGIELDLDGPTTDEELASRFLYEAIGAGLVMLVH